MDWKLPFALDGRESSPKAGWFKSQAERDFREQCFGYELSGGFDVNNPNSYLNNPAYLNYGPNASAASARTTISPASSICHRPTPSSPVGDWGQYLMTDLAVLPWCA